MTIKARLLITTIIAVGLSLVISFFIFSASQGLNEINEEHYRAEGVASGVFELNILTNDYILYRNQRSRDQWWSRYNSTAMLLIEIEKFEHLERQEIIGNLQEDHKSMAITFFQLVTILGREGARKDKVFQELEERLVAQLLIQSQAMVSGASMLAEQVRQKSTEKQQQVSLFFMIAISIMALIVVVSSLSTMRNILKPIMDLQRGAKIIGKGNLKHRINIKSKDEIGRLASTFNTMVDKLEESYSNLKEKSKELAKTIERITHEKEKVNTILQSIAEGVFVIDTDYEITMFSQTAADMSGFTSREAIGKRYDDILQFVLEKDEKVNDKFIIKAMRTGEITEMSNHTVLIKKDGSRLPVADSAATMKDNKGNIVGCVVVFRDATRERKIDQMKSEFISTASHQLRTPMTGIQWVVERFLKKEKVSKRGGEYLNDIHTSSQRLSNLIDLLLNVSRIEGGQVSVSPHPLRLVEFIKSCLTEWEPLCVKKNLSCSFREYPIHLTVITDRSALDNIVQSLISNAIEYTPKGGKVEVSLKEEKDHFLFVVRDTGIGIPKEEQATIFDKFTRGSNAVLIKTDGTGLGLYVVKQAVELLDGKIRFDSKEGRGTTFYVELPLKSKKKVGEKKFA